MHKLGETRSRYRHDHLLQTPDTFVFAPLPGMTRATAAIHAAPAMGADFTQYTAVLENEGTLGPAMGSRFLYVIEGSVAVEVQGKKNTLQTRGYAILPVGVEHTVTALEASRLAVLEKRYTPLAATPEPTVILGDESNIPPTALMGDDDLQVRAMVPDHPSWDFAVNTMTYAPGAALSMVEVHAMEHGLLMLEGGGIYRLGESWYPVQTGDFIWMAPYCPQWFGAIGKQPAKYLIYKDWNRHPLQGELR